MNISRNNVGNMYLEVRLELFESCIIPESNFQIRTHGIRKMTRISIKKIVTATSKYTRLRIVSQVGIRQGGGGGGGGGLVPYTMITNCFAQPCGHVHIHTYTSRSRAS